MRGRYEQPNGQSSRVKKRKEKENKTNRTKQKQLKPPNYRIKSRKENYKQP